MVAGTESIASAMITTDLDVNTRNAYVQASIEYFDGAGGSLGTDTATAIDVTWKTLVNDSGQTSDHCNRSRSR